MALIESPPASKKFARTPIGERPRTSSRASTTTASTSERGLVVSASHRAEGAGSAFRSSLPLRVRGNSASRMNTEGTM